MKLAVGIFVITLLLAIIAFSYLILKEKGTFEARYSFYFNTQSANSFSIGMPLRFAGFRIGVIDEIALNDDGSVKVTFSVNEENRKWISEYSMLLLQRPLIGSPHIEVYSTVGNKPLEDGSSIDIIISDDINAMISKLEPVVDKLINIITSIDKITSTLSADDSEIFEIVSNIKIFTTNLAKNDALLTTITGDQKAAQSLIRSLESLANIMHNTDLITAKVDQDIVQPSSLAIKELHAILTDVNKKLETLDPTVQSIGALDEDLVGLKDQVAVTLQKSNQILDKVDAIMLDETKEEVMLP
jgi:phospholipid/cholesterol/gamma-HCH transport system substrate-binding protein